MKAAIIMFVYAVLMGLGGLWAYLSAPPGAKALTALIIPGVCGGVMVVCGLMAMQIHRSRLIGMIGIHLGLVLPLVFAVAIGMRAWASTQKVLVFEKTTLAWEDAVSEETQKDEPAVKEVFFKAAGAPSHDLTYQRNALWGLCGLSLVAFGLLLAARPKVEKRA